MLTRRAAARFFDSGVLLFSFVLVRLVLLRFDLPSDLLGALSLAIAALVWWLYEAGLVARRGATVGKRLVFVRVVGAAGAPPPRRAAAVRAAPVLLLAFPLFWPLTVVAWLSVPFTEDGRGLHDRLAGTRAIRAPWRTDDPG